MASLKGKTLTSQNHRMSVSLEETSDNVYLRNSASTSNTRDEDFFSNAELSTLKRVGRTSSRATGAGQTAALDGAIAAVNDLAL